MADKIPLQLEIARLFDQLRTHPLLLAYAARLIQHHQQALEARAPESAILTQANDTRTATPRPLTDTSNWVSRISQGEDGPVHGR